MNLLQADEYNHKTGLSIRFVKKGSAAFGGRFLLRNGAEYIPAEKGGIT